jgi:hypothetical protein
MRRALLQSAWISAAAIGLVAFPAAQSARPAVPLQPIDAILDAFRTHAVVALGEGVSHGDEAAYGFRLALLRDRRFVETVNDVVVELGNARYQDLIDRFVRGEDVSDDSLRHVWQDTTQPSVVADFTIYQDFFRAVRALNVLLPEGRRLRVLLGDPPIEWEHVTSPDEFLRWLEQRDSYPAHVIRTEVLAKGHRALVIYGQMHFQRRNVMSNYDMSIPAAQTLVSLLEQNVPRSVFTIWPIPDLEKLQSDVASWPVPSIARITGTVLGATDFGAYRSPNEPRMSVENGQFVAVPRDRWKTLRADEQFDAVMYEGPRGAIQFAKPAASLCADAQHVQERLKRIALAGLPPSEGDRLRSLCAK